MSKVTVVSTVNHEVGIAIPELRFKHDWRGIGSKISIEKELLEQMMFDPGVAYMFETGMLYIEDMEVKKELGLEPEDATEPQNIIILDNKMMDRMIGAMPLHEFKEKARSVSKEQLKNLVDYAVEKEQISFEKSDFLKELTGLNAIKLIEFKRANKEE